MVYENIAGDMFKMERILFLSTVHLNLQTSLRGFQIQVSKGAGLVTCWGENEVGRGGALSKLDLTFGGRHSRL